MRAMKSSKYAGSVKSEIEKWEQRLQLVTRTLEEWAECQKTWMSLERVFSAQDMQEQLPTEAAKFAVISKSWKQIMLQTRGKPKVLSSVMSRKNLIGNFQRHKRRWVTLKKKIQMFLDVKRSNFPRFYFLSDQELIAIISHARNPERVQPHFIKCFDAIEDVDFRHEKGQDDIDGAPQLVITAMKSPQGECVAFNEPVRVDGCAAEDIFSSIEVAMRSSLRSKLLEAIKMYPSGKMKRWISAFPAQCVLAADQIVWTKKVESGDTDTSRSTIEELVQYSRVSFLAQCALRSAISSYKTCTTVTSYRT